MTISVVLLQYRLPEYTRIALQSVLESDLAPSEIILVDNGSPEEEISWAETFPVKIIRLTENIGYVRGTNVGCRAAQNEFIFLLNNDLSLSRQCIRRMVAALQKYPKIGWLTACYQRGPWDNSKTPMPTHIERELDQSKGASRDKMNAWSERLGDEPAIEYCNKTEGTAIMVRKSISLSVGEYWDELWGHHTHDYSLRLKANGYQTAACKNAVFWHSTEHPTVVAAFGDIAMPERYNHSTQLMNTRYGTSWR